MAAPSRGRGIYFPDDEYKELEEEVALLSYETRRPISRSEFVRNATRVAIQKNRARREKGNHGLVGNE